VTEEIRRNQHDQRVKAIFDEVCTLGPPARARRLAEACGTDDQLRGEIETLLDFDQRRTSLLDTPCLDQRERQLVLTTDGHDGPHHLPKAIGRYRVRRAMGRGSTATVFEADQDRPRRKVAVKVLRPGLFTSTTFRRFRYESELLGRLDHPYIARIYDSGTTDLGSGPQPFLVMELVEGRPLTHYVREHDLPVHGRLELLAKVCDGVHHAHTKGIIHRDLKPGNILVNADGEPRILDFGVARAADRDLVSRSLQTAVGQLIGTLQYMSPEQAAGAPDEIDTRSDIYALGVIGYEVLAGELPYQLSERTLPDAARTIAHTEPPRLGTIQRSLRGDVETIIAKALEKDKERRYQSAADMAADLRRHLRHEPILARPPGTVYQLGKWARRNRGLFGGMVVAAVLAVAGLAATAYWLQQVRAARDESMRVTEILAGIVASASPDRLGREAQVRQVLDELARSMERDLTGSPQIEAHLHHSFGHTYLGLGEYPLAARHLEQAVELRRRSLGGEHPETLRSQTFLAVAYRKLARYDDCEALCLETLEQCRRRLGEEHPITLDARNALTSLRIAQSRYGEVESLSAESLAICRRVFEPEDERTLTASNSLARIYKAQGRYDEAEPLYVATLEIRRRRLGDEDPYTLMSMNNLGSLYQEQGRHDEAEPLYVKTLQLRSRVLGETHRATLISMNNLGLLYNAQARYEKAGALLEKALELRRLVMGPEHPDTLEALNNLAMNKMNQGLHDEAEPLYVEGLEIQRRTLGPGHSTTLKTMVNLAGLYHKKGRHDEAEPLYGEALRSLRRELGPEHPTTLTAMNNLAVLYRKTGRYDKAEPLFRATMEIRLRVLGDEHRNTLISMVNLGGVYNKLGRYDEAEPLLAAAVERAPRSLREGHWFTGVFKQRYGVCLTGQKRYAEAEVVLLEAREVLEASFGPEHDWTVKAVRALVDLYAAWNRHESAASWRAELPAVSSAP